MKIKIHRKEGVQMPTYATTGSAGMDIRAFITEPITLTPFTPTKIPTGIFIEIPLGYECQIRPRSSFGLKGISIPNSPATIDSDFRGELMVILNNQTNTDYTIENGERIAQMVFAEYTIAELEDTPLQALSETERGTGGLGSTGKF